MKDGFTCKAECQKRMILLDRIHSYNYEGLYQLLMGYFNDS